jgi:hypothetical protein
MKLAFLFDNIKARAFHVFSNTGSRKDDQVSITLVMPKDIWFKFHKYLDVDVLGKPLTRGKIYEAGDVVEETDYKITGCGRHGCKIALPKGMAVNGPCTCDAVYNKQKLIWEQKNRKEREK